MDSYDTIIIGSGMAGLAAGIRLAMFDKRVLILEKHNAPGGLNGFYFLGGRKCDVGLHAVTNFVEPGRKGTPLGKLCRQLRISREAFKLAPQKSSRIAFPGRDLRFNNNFDLLEAEVRREFPSQIDGFIKLRKCVREFDPFHTEENIPGAREIITKYISDPVLEDMLLCPLMYYGSAREEDMDFDQFVIMWNALFEEGFARPFEGVRVIIRTLLNRYRELGGERRMRCGVKRILHENGRASGVELENGEVLQAETIISTAGWPETCQMANYKADAGRLAKMTGKLSFTETMTFLDSPVSRFGVDETIIFFNDSEQFRYASPTDEVDPRSGVICFPENYQYEETEQFPEGILRLTAMANFERWKSFDTETYGQKKLFWYDKLLESALRFVPGLSPHEIRDHTNFTDMFTPLTVSRFTSHAGGAIYGSADKKRSGETGIEGLVLAGTDQGFLGIIGAMLSGISMANKHVLSD